MTGSLLNVDTRIQERTNIGVKAAVKQTSRHRTANFNVDLYQKATRASQTKAERAEREFEEEVLATPETHESRACTWVLYGAGALNSPAFPAV